MKLSIENLNLKIISLGFFLSQFYLWSSGLPQFSHLLISISIFLVLIISRKLDITSISLLGVFVIYAILVNIIWSLLLDDLSFIVSTVYWVFNFFTLVVLINFSDQSKEKFLNYLTFLIPLSYFVNILIWGAGQGRYDFSPRYNGFFNDPNQMAFWILASCSIYLYLVEDFCKKIYILLLAGFLIALTMSRSATLGFVVLIVGFILNSKGSIYKKIIYVSASFLIVIVSLFIFYFLGYFDSIAARFSEGIDDKSDQTSSRGFDNLINYPQYLLFGAGQGAYHLYSQTGNEIHSTWLGILFYYGIIGFLIFIYLIFSILSKLNLSNKFIFLGPLIYGFFTYNARTIIFWFFIYIFLIRDKRK